MEGSRNVPIIVLEEEDSSPPANRRSRVRKGKTEDNETFEDTDEVKKRTGTRYLRYKPQWEKEEIFAKWLHRTPENLIELGKPEAYCVFCQQCLRAHKSDLLAHAKSKKHKDSANKSPNTTWDCRSFIESYVPDAEDQVRGEKKYEASDSPSKRTRGKSSKPIASKAAVIEQINAEFEDTMEKIKVCREELGSLEVKKARLEFELEYYNDN